MSERKQGDDSDDAAPSSLMERVTRARLEGSDAKRTMLLDTCPTLVLIELVVHPGSSAKELRESLKRRKKRVNEALDALYQWGLVRREPRQARGGGWIWFVSVKGREHMRRPVPPTVARD